MALDMFAYMLGKGQGGSGGSGSGGGSGDLSLATVTFKNTGDDSFYSDIPHLDSSDSNPSGRTSLLVNEIQVPANDTVAIQVPLYQGAFVCRPYTLIDGVDIRNASLSGSISLDKNLWVTITGDCTISGSPTVEDQT